MIRLAKETIYRGASAFLTLGVLGACLLGSDSRADLKTKETPKKADSGISVSASGLTTGDETLFATRFSKEIWPLLSRKESGCTACHTGKNASQLSLDPAAEVNFKAMLGDGHFDAENVGGLLARVSAPPSPAKMPPAPFKAWTEGEIGVLRSFVNDLYAKRQKNTKPTDEMFPLTLATAYKGKPLSTGTDNTFLTYTQLRGKIKTIFNDDWQRDDRDLFTENLAQFGGADFVRSFNESTRPTAQFFSSMDLMSNDVASRAFLLSTGPFSGRAQALPSLLKMTLPDAQYRLQINRLYRKMLYRDATETELKSAFGFIKTLYAQKKGIAAQNYDLRFELTAKDENKLETVLPFRIRVTNDGYAIGQSFVNENAPAGKDEKAHLAWQTLADTYTFKASKTGAGENEQCVIVGNEDTHRQVILHGIEIASTLPGDTMKKKILVTDPTVKAEGSWRMDGDHGIPCYRDENNHKGASRLVFPVKVEKSGDYKVTLLWRPGGVDDYAENLPVEVQHYGKTVIALPPLASVPPKGEAHFTVDMSDDTVSFRDLKTAFKFRPNENEGVEISNKNTKKTVSLDAVRLTPTKNEGKPLLILVDEATGHDKWKEYKNQSYTFYKPVSPKMKTDEEKDKGKLSLLYSPSVKKAEFRENAFYKVEVGYPGENRNDTAVPVIVKAAASSPIVRVAAPNHAVVGSQVTLDAGGSYNVQGTALRFSWRQVGGAKVTLKNPTTSQLTFTLPSMTPEQAAWEGLCRAMMKHPDFLYTRPLTLATTKDPATKKRLQLVKIAQDLINRSPNETELTFLEKGATLAQMTERYLASTEFADAYFHRVRLYLESHGTEEDDEPARLWTYIALNNRPYKEILTAEYTVGTDWKKQSRPTYHGKSGLLTMKGFVKGKPGLPHYNYPAQVCEKFLGYVFEVPEEVVKIRNGLTASSTTAPGSVCYSCHKILTPLAFQRTRWTDEGVYKPTDGSNRPIDDSDNNLVATYAFKGNGMEAFATQAADKERFLRTIIQTHFVFFFGREMRYEQDERGLYKRLWDTVHSSHYNIKSLIRSLVTSPEYLNGTTKPNPLNGAFPKPRKLFKHPPVNGREVVFR